MLKHLRNRYMWVGEVVHELVELALGRWRRGQDITVDALVERGTRRMRADYAESLQGIYRERPANTCGLIEHEYAEGIARDEWQAQRDRMERCIRNFFALPLTATIRATPVWRWMALETLGSFELDQATILVKPDFAWRDDDGRLVLVDWKTGAPHPDERLQLAVYGIFAQRHWGFAAHEMSGQLVYLNDGRVETLPIDAAMLAEAERDVLVSVTRMRDLAGTEAPASLDAARFPLTDAQETCARCNFRRVCHPAR